MLYLTIAKQECPVTIFSMSAPDNYPQGDATTQLFRGVVMPIPFVIYGLMCIFNRVGAVPGRYGNILLYGINAVILGIACISFAAMLHFQYYWGLSPKPEMRENFSMGKTSSLLILIASLAWVTWCLIRGFIFG